MMVEHIFDRNDVDIKHIEEFRLVKTMRRAQFKSNYIESDCDPFSSENCSSPKCFGKIDCISSKRVCYFYSFFLRLGCGRKRDKTNTK